MTDGFMIRDTGPPCGQGAFIRIDGDGFCGALDIAAGDGQLFGIWTGNGKVSVPDGALFSQKAFFQPAFEILNDRDVRRIGTGGLHHVEGVQVVSPEDVAIQPPGCSRGFS